MPDSAALFAAITSNDVARTDALLSTHSDLRALLTRRVPHDPFGATVFMHPATNGNLEMVDVLLRHGADINARSDWWAGGFGVLDTCAPAIAPALMARGATVDAHAAARLGMRDTLVQLLDANPALVHARGGDGQTPLHFAANVDIASELLKRGAEIDAIDVDHESTPAQYMLRDRPEVARYLVTRGCRTDILMAAALGADELVRKHLAADPGAIRTRVSAKWFPMRNPHAGGTIYQWTLARHASPHSVARDAGYLEIYRYLMSQTPDDLKLLRAAECGDATLARELIASGASFSPSMNDEDRSSVAIASAAGNTATARLLLEAGFPTDVRGQNGGSPLHWAAWLGNAELVGVLVQYGAALEDRGNEFHMTPLGWALHGSLHSWRKDEGDYGATVRSLLDAGAAAPIASAKVEASDAAIAALSAHRTRQLPSAPPS